MSEYTGKKVSTFRERFSELCDSNPMNDTAIADALHVSRQTVCSWKAGTRSPKAPTVLSIANYFAVDVGWLMGFDVEKYNAQAVLEKAFRDQGYIVEEQPKNNDIRLLVRDLNKLSPEQVEQAKAVFRAMFQITNPELFKEGNNDDA